MANASLAESKLPVLSIACCSFISSSNLSSGRLSGRPGGNRTPNLRFWRPPLCQLSYWPVSFLNDSLLLDDLGDDAGADGLAALADGEAQTVFHGDRADERHHHLGVVPRHHHLRALRQLARTSDVGGPEVKLRTVAVKERGVAAALFLGQHVHLGLELGVRGDGTGLGQHLAALHFLTLGASQEHAQDRK